MPITRGRNAPVTLTACDPVINWQGLKPDTLPRVEINYVVLRTHPTTALVKGRLPRADRENLTLLSLSEIIFTALSHFLPWRWWHFLPGPSPVCPVSRDWLLVVIISWQLSFSMPRTDQIFLIVSPLSLNTKWFSSVISSVIFTKRSPDVGFGF